MRHNNKPIKWYNYVAAFFAALFLTNFIPHFVKGVCGDPFPSPFADPPGKGLSSPLVNVLWGLANLLVGYLLYRAGKVDSKKTGILILFFIGVVCMSLMLANTFADKASL